MALDKKQIALSVVGIISGFALTYILWSRSQQANAATAANAAAQAAANAEEQAQSSQQLDYAEGNLTSGTGSSGTIYEDSSSAPTVAASTDNSTNDITSLVSSILDDANGTTSSVPSNPLIPEVTVSDGTSSLSGIDTSAAQILGTAAPSTVSSTTSTGQTYGATTSSTAGSDSNIYTDGGNPVSTRLPVTTLTSSQSVQQ